MLAEGSWLAVLYAALQAIGGQVAWMGPVELGVMAWAGMAWGRRRRWSSPVAEAIGLPLLALAAGAFGWLLDPAVRGALATGQPVAALSLHGAGWVAALAFWRGEVHRSRDDDDAIQDRLLRWAVPGLAVPWLIGHVVTSGRLEEDFTAAAFVGTIFFIGSAFTAMGLARLEAVRVTTGSDWRSNRSWVVLILGIALALTAVTIPAGAFLGVSAHALLVAILGPLQTFLFLLVLLATPIILLGALLADLIQPLLPEGFGLGQLTPPSGVINQRQASEALPAALFYVIIGALIAFELFVLGVMIWLRRQERRRMRAAGEDPFEERSIVVPSSGPRAAVVPATARRSTAYGIDDPAGAYLAALESLRRDGRWPRHAQETPAGHAARVRGEGLVTPAFGRLAAAYQLVRYGARPVAQRERSRARGRLQAFRSWLSRV
ncbi:MAG TPA: DUF4129 domain-containing protein [Candidatus Limnocylindria bacterium]|nr:DUF4129 domain-containing protein [Candidatus Limnocylindria bacterium]